MSQPSPYSDTTTTPDLPDAAARVIADLEATIADIRAGKVSGVLLVTTYPDGTDGGMAANIDGIDRVVFGHLFFITDSLRADVLAGIQRNTRASREEARRKVNADLAGLKEDGVTVANLEADR